MSLPSRECGLKLLDQGMNKITQGVTPLAGVWIEISLLKRAIFVLLVTPLAGVWIEIVYLGGDYGPSKVTPLAGVWIEIPSGIWGILNTGCHSPRGSVD